MGGKDPNPTLDSGFVTGISEFGDISNHQGGVRWENSMGKPLMLLLLKKNTSQVL
jgi:hypothetical protein